MLTDARCKAAKPQDKPYKLADSNGLYLYVTPTGFKSWRWKYRIGKTEKRMVFGPYPDVSLAMARELRDDARKLKRQGRDPAEALKQERDAKSVASANTFEAVATLWHTKKLPTWSENHAANVLKSLQDEVFPKIGKRPVTEITAPMVLALLRPVEERGAIDLTHRLRQRISDVFVFAIASGLATADPAASLGKALPPVKKRKYPALRSIEDARGLLVADEAQAGHPLTKLASRLMAATAVRSEPLRYAEPHEFEDLDGSAPIWRIPPEKMKLDLDAKDQEAFEFIVPLSTYAVAIVKLALHLSKPGPFLFPGMRHPHKPMSENALSIRYRRLPEFAGRHVPHGWRSTFSTVMNERAIELDRPGDRAIIDLMLAHKPDGVEATYNRAAYMPRRRAIAEEWAELLLGPLPPPEALLAAKRR